MLGIKYIADKFPASALGMWKNKITGNMVERTVRAYVFNDLFAILVHICLTVVFAVATNFCPDFSLSADIVDVLYGWLGLIPLLACAAPYLVYALLWWPISSGIAWLLKKFKR